MKSIFNRVGLGFVGLVLVAVFIFANSVGAAITSTFTSLQTVANVPTATVSFPALSGGADAVSTSSITAGALSGGVDEVLATGSIELTAGAAGSVNSLTVGGVEILGAIVPFNTDLTQTAADVASQITSFSSVPEYTATNTGAVVNITATAGSGSLPNTAPVSGSATTITLGNANAMSGGVSEVKATSDTSSFISVTSQSGADLTLNIGGTVTTLIAGNTDVQAATSLASQITADGGNAYTATVVNTNQVRLTAKASGTSGNAALIATDLDYNTASASAATSTSNSFVAISSGAGADLTLNIGGTAITLVAGDTAVQAATAVAGAITADALNNPYSASVVNTDQVELVHDTAGVGGNGAVVASNTNYNTTAQVVTFTPATVSVGETFTATINSNDYDYLSLTGDDAQDVVDALATDMNADSDVDCVADVGFITCTASVAGTSFTFNTDVDDVTDPVISSISFTPSTGTAKIGDAITLNITSDQAGYSAGAITVNGVATTGFASAGGTNYVATYTVVSGDTNRSSGTVPASVVLDDGDGNSNTASTTVTANTLAIDAEAPTLDSAETTSTTTIDLTFSEDIDGSTVNSSGSEFTVVGHTVSGASKTGVGVVTLTLSPAMATSEIPDVTFTNIDNFKDQAGNQAISPATVTPTDGVAPVISETTPVSTPDNDATPDYTFTSGEAGSITYGGSCSSSTSSAVVGANTITFASLADGTYSNCTIKVTDSSTNQSNTLAVSSFTVDTVLPTVVLSSLITDPTNDSPILVTATFSETVTGFTGADLDLVNGILVSFSGSGSVYNFNVLPFVQGPVTVDLDSSSAQDLAGNNNTSATQFDITYDTVVPVITLTGTSPVSIEYGETYTDLGATASDTNDGNLTTSIATVNPVDTSTLGTYTVTYNVTDAAGNVATQVTRTVNVVQRAITVTANTDTKVYDGNNTSSVTPSITSGSLAFGQVANFTQSYNNKNVGTGKTLTPAGTVTDGNGGANYAVTFVTDATGVITAKALTVSATGVNKMYDGTNTASVTLSDDRVSGDILTTSYTSATFSDKHVGTGKTVSVSGISVTSTDAGNYTWNTTTSTTANITTRPVTVTAVTNTKVYDTNTSAGAAPTLSVNTIATGDTAIMSETYDNANVAGSPNKVMTPAIAITDGNSGNNYAVTLVTSATGVITVAPVTVGFTADNKIYDGNNSATILTRNVTGAILPDVVTASGGTATFSDENIGSGKTVTGTGFTLNDANYSITSITSTTANITPKALTITSSATNKVYDGNTTASVTLSDDKVSGDNVVVTNTGSTFSDKNVGVGKTVTTSFTVTGTDAGNYTPTSSPVTTTANITAKDLTVTATGIDKTDNGTTVATVTLSDNRVSGDVLTTAYTSASFADSNVGVAKPVSVTGISISGTDAGNYNLLNTTASTTANINSQSSGSSGSRGGRLPTTVVTPQVPAPGQVLGAVKFNFTQNMRAGVVGPEVLELQKLLNGLGFGPLVVDGKFGPKTKAAVVKFQLANGLVGDGIVGPLTRAMLNK